MKEYDIRTEDIFKSFMEGFDEPDIDKKREIKSRNLAIVGKICVGFINASGQRAKDVPHTAAKIIVAGIVGSYGDGTALSDETPPESSVVEKFIMLNNLVGHLLKDALTINDFYQLFPIDEECKFNAFNNVRSSRKLLNSFMQLSNHTNENGVQMGLSDVFMCMYPNKHVQSYVSALCSAYKAAKDFETPKLLELMRLTAYMHAIDENVREEV